MKYYAATDAVTCKPATELITLNFNLFPSFIIILISYNTIQGIVAITLRRGFLIDKTQNLIKTKRKILLTHVTNKNPLRADQKRISDSIQYKSNLSTNK